MENYKRTKQAEANKILYTDQFLKLEMARFLSSSSPGRIAYSADC